MWKTVSKGINKWVHQRQRYYKLDSFGNKINLDVKIEIENYWKDYVTKTCSAISLNKRKQYVLSMFPYPSGHLHMGHARVYAISDSIARHHRMSGMNIIHPMGWDSFGLPAENAAIERKISPNIWTKNNIQSMKEQLYDLGCNFDWDREISTCDPLYYKWTQYIFLELFKAGLAYKKKAYVNWDPVDQTVLADEQVDNDGFSWRSGAKVEKALLNQWFIKTTFFAKDLYDGLNTLEPMDWKEIISLQKHWIGECNGVSIDFELLYDNNSNHQNDTLTAWTQYPEYILSSKFIALPSRNILNDKNLVVYENDKFKRLSVCAKNPITNENLPIFITDEIEYPEGDHAYIGSPQTNDFDKKFAIIANLNIEDSYEDIRSNKDILTLRKSICEILQSKNIGGYLVSSKLKDWLISRQRFWGTPIPVVHCESCGTQALPFDELPVQLPNLSNNNSLYSLNNIEEWINTHCPNCGGHARRETDTMDTFVDSSWYYLRYLDPKNNIQPFSKEKLSDLLPVDIYIGGKEHAVLHLYYARFINYFLHFIGKVPEKEPFHRLLVQGMVMGKSYKIKSSGKYIPESLVKVIDENKLEATTLDDNLPVEITWEKMSKSKFNGVDPSEIIKDYGCDTTRLLILASVPPMAHRHWSEETFPGILNWQHKLWEQLNSFKLYRNSMNTSFENDVFNSETYKENETKLCDSRNYFVSNTTYHFRHTHQLSLAISKMQSLTTALRKVSKEIVPHSKEFELLLACQIIMLAPITPHFASEMWAGFIDTPHKINTTHPFINWDKNVLDQDWPIVDTNYKLILYCIVNGALVCHIGVLPEVLHTLDKNSALALALNDKKVAKKTTKGIEDISFRVYPNCRAVIIIKTSQKILQPKNETCENIN